MKPSVEKIDGVLEGAIIESVKHLNLIQEEKIVWQGREKRSLLPWFM